MKRITRRVQALNERASELTAAASQLPQRVAELRQAATATTSELQSLKTGIQINVPDLLVKREDELSTALAEVAAHAPVFAEAGFILDGLDLEISPLQQIIVQLLNHREVETLSIQPLIQRYQQQKYVRAILSAIVKAKAVVSTIEIDGLDYSKLTVAIGPVPTIRLCWRERPTEAEVDESPTPAASQPRRDEASATRPDSFFGSAPVLAPLSKSGSAGSAGTATPDPVSKEAPAAAESQPEIPAPSPSDPATQTPPTPPTPPVDAQDPLARFKVMPTFGPR